MKKIMYFILFSLLVTFFYLSVSNTYSLFTKRIDKTGSISTIKSEATFLPGSDFIVKIKTLSGDVNPTSDSQNTTITSIERSDTLLINPTSNNIVSSNDSVMPIYAWFNNGTIYYYSEADNLFMNQLSTNMFRQLNEVTSIDIDKIDTSRVVDMGAMFWQCKKLQSIDVSNFNTSNVVYMHYMFGGCESLEEIDVSNFNTSKVTYIQAMFNSCNKLTRLDLSNFDLNKIPNSTNIASFFSSNLKELKTPKIYPADSSITLSLPKTMYDENMVSYTALGKSTTPVSPTSTWLKEGYTVTFNPNGGTVSPSSKTFRKDSTYGVLPTPVKTGYTFKGWNGKNLLNYYDLFSAALTAGISVDENGNITDTSPLSDTRHWNYNYSNWHFTLDAGTYTITLLFSKQATNEGALTYSNLALSTNSGNIFIKSNGCLANKDSYIVSFTLDETKDLGLLIKVYDGIYKIQIEKNSEATEWEPYYVLSTTNVTQEQNHILKAIWEASTYTVSFDKGNLLYGLEPNQALQTPSITHGMSYSITNGIVEVISTANDGYGFTNGRVYLEKGKKYIFNCETDASEWGIDRDVNDERVDNVQAYLNLDYGWTYFIPLNSSQSFEFTPSYTGEFTLRLDVNKANTTHHFWNITIKEKDVETKDVVYNSLYGTLPSPTREKYVFTGWNTSEDGTGSTISSNSTVSITSNQTLYAMWNPLIVLNENVNYFTETSTSFNGFNGTENTCFTIGRMSLDGINAGDTLLLESYMAYSNLTADDTKEFYMRLQNYGNVTSWQNGLAYQDIKYYYRGEGNFRLNWKFSFNSGFDSNDYYVFHLRTDYYTGGSVGIRNVKIRKISEKEVIYNSTYGTLPTPTRTGYTFIGWNTKEDGTGTTITSSSNVTSKNPITLYAKWQANTYTITFDANGGNTPYPETKSLTYGTTLGSNPVNVFTNNNVIPNYKLSSDPMNIGFVDDETSPTGKAIRIERTGQGTAIYAGYYLSINGSNGLAVGQTYTIKVRAKGNGNWLLGSEQYYPQTTLTLTNEYKDYTIDFVADNRRNRAVVHYAFSTYDSDAYAQFQPIEILAYMPNVGKNGYDFNGWYTETNGGTLVTKDSPVPAGNTTYYAHWVARTTTVTFNPQGGSVSPTSKSVTYDSTYGDLPTPERTGYTFLGWNTSTDGNGTYISSDTIVKNYSPYTIYAIWQDDTSLVAGKTWNYSYTGNEQRFIPPVNGTYKIETWGASGGSANVTYYGGTGGYNKGNIDLTTTDNLYIYVGGAGYCGQGEGPLVKGGYNGGGDANIDSGTWKNRTFCSGGGSTDIRLINGSWDNFDSLKSRIMVASAGGGSNNYTSTYHAIGGNAGGLNGYPSTGQGGNNTGSSSGATQTSGYKFGIGEMYTTTTNGGGSGYYGGRSATWLGGAGGSSFISGYSGCDAISSSSTSTNIVHTNQPNHYSGKIFNSGTMQMIDGAGCDWSSGSASSTCDGQIQPEGTTTTGHTGNGYARITLISID